MRTVCWINELILHMNQHAILSTKSLHDALTCLNTDMALDMQAILSSYLQLMGTFGALSSPIDESQLMVSSTAALITQGQYWPWHSISIGARCCVLVECPIACRHKLMTVQYMHVVL